MAQVLASIWKENVLRSFLVETQHKEWEETQFVYLRLKQGRNAHLELKGVSVLPNEEECSKEVIKNLHRAVLLGICLPLANCCTSFPVLKQFPTYVHIFSQDIFSTEACGSLASTIMGWFPLLFYSYESFCTCTVWELSLTSGVVISCSLLQMSSSPVINFVLGASRENKIQFYSSWKLPAALLRAHLPPTSITIYKKGKSSHAEYSLHLWSLEVSEVGEGQAVHWSKWTIFSYF